MQNIVQFFPLRVTAHSDRTNIVAAYSRTLGRVGFAVPSGAGAGAARRRALLMPLNPVEGVATGRPGRDLLNLREPRALMPLHTVMSSPERLAVTMFLAEVLERILRQPEPDPPVFDLIMLTMQQLNDPAVNPANVHLCFMIRLAELLGIAPDPEEMTQTEALILRMDFNNQHLYRFAREQRGEILKRIIDYYTEHLVDLTGLRSPHILHALPG